jgi:hypothetical protein
VRLSLREQNGIPFFEELAALETRQVHDHRTLRDKADLVCSLVPFVEAGFLPGQEGADGENSGAVERLKPGRSLIF